MTFEQAAVSWTIWMLEHNFLILYFALTLGIMVASFVYVYLKHGAEAFKPAQGTDSDYSDNLDQDRKLAKKLKDMKKGRGGF